MTSRIINEQHEHRERYASTQAAPGTHAKVSYACESVAARERRPPNGTRTSLLPAARAHRQRRACLRTTRTRLQSVAHASSTSLAPCAPPRQTSRQNDPHGSCRSRRAPWARQSRLWAWGWRGSLPGSRRLAIGSGVAPPVAGAHAHRPTCAFPSSVVRPFSEKGRQEATAGRLSHQADGGPAKPQQVIAPTSK